jgi:tetratricopeptide (TPR) repeat protein
VRPAGPADPDAFAALEEQRDFLLLSIDDLEREYEAGDVDEADYHALKDDYTARAAAVLRALDDGRARYAAVRPRRSWPRLVGIFAVVALLATGAGLLLARASGTRGTGDQVSGDIRLTNRDRLLEALDRLTAGEPVAALELYDEVLETEPDNVEALTYRGWTLVLSQLPEDGLQWLDRAVEVDPDYPDARALRAVTLARFLDRPDEALADLDALDGDSLAPDIAPLVEGLRATLEGTGASPPPPTTVAP